MHRLLFILFLAVGACNAVYWQKLTCPFSSFTHESLQRVWCRESSDECCTGLTFSRSAHSANGGKLMVIQDSDSFTVAVLEPSYGEGVYWCGVLSKNGTIIKLAERYFYSTSGLYIWSLSRWFLLPLLPLITIFTNIYTRAVSKRTSLGTADSYDDVGVSTAMNEEPVYELE